MPCPESAAAPAPARCVPRGRPPPPASRLARRPAPHALLSTRQRASAFNQPLSFDTSNVTRMDHMFWVRSSPYPAPNLHSSPPLHAACTAVARHLPPPGTLHLAPHRMPFVRSRQGASAFNQPLSFDTSSVTDMRYMFWVRSSPCPAPSLHSSPPCMLHAPQSPAASRLASACASRTRCVVSSTSTPLRHCEQLSAPASRLASHSASYAFLSTRQDTPSLSDANKLLIRCAWAGTSAFAS